jgi:hypothetical protein
MSVLKPTNFPPLFLLLLSPPFCISPTTCARKGSTAAIYNRYGWCGYCTWHYQDSVSSLEISLNHGNMKAEPSRLQRKFWASIIRLIAF